MTEPTFAAEVREGRPLHYVKDAIRSQLNRAILLCDVIPDGNTE